MAYLGYTPDMLAGPAGAPLPGYTINLLKSPSNDYVLINLSSFLLAFMLSFVARESTRRLSSPEVLDGKTVHRRLYNHMVSMSDVSSGTCIFAAAPRAGNAAIRRMTDCYTVACCGILCYGDSK